ncbi:protein Star-like isoform X2 [Palaemon carinicauda]
MDGAMQGDTNSILYLSLLLLRASWNGPFLNDPDKEDFSDYGQSVELSKILEMKKNGFFIEAYAGDGENGSVSLYFERKLDWVGLLVEYDFNAFEKLIEKERSSYGLNVGVATTDRIKLIKNRLDEDGWVDPRDYHLNVPLYSLYMVMGGQEVDLLILDTKGTEMEILQTVPWESVKIRVMCIAYTHIPGNTRALSEYLSLKGYTLLKTHVKDMFFASNEFLAKQKQDRRR